MKISAGTHFDMGFFFKFFEGRNSSQHFSSYNYIEYVWCVFVSETLNEQTKIPVLI